MCEPALRTPGIVSNSALTNLVVRTSSCSEVSGLVNQCIRKSRSLKFGSSDCPSTGSTARPATVVTTTAA